MVGLLGVYNSFAWRTAGHASVANSKESASESAPKPPERASGSDQSSTAACLHICNE